MTLLLRPGLDNYTADKVQTDLGREKSQDTPFLNGKKHRLMKFDVKKATNRGRVETNGSLPMILKEMNPFLSMLDHSLPWPPWPRQVSWLLSAVISHVPAVVAKATRVMWAD